MIGEKMRGYRHLCRSVGNGNKRSILCCGHNNIYGELFVKQLSNQENYSSLFINSYTGKSQLPEWVNSKDAEIISKANIRNANYRSFHYMYDFIGFCSYTILLPDDFIKGYDDFLSNNKKLCLDVVERYSERYNFNAFLFYVYSNASPNYFSWALNNLYKYNTPRTIIVSCLEWIDTYPQLIKKLGKGTPLAYNGAEQMVALYGEMIALRSNKRVNDVVNMFNTAQKKLLKDYNFEKKDIESASKFSVLSKEKQLNFIRKMSTMENANEIIKQMSLLTKTHFNWNKESVLEFIHNAEDLNCSVTYDKDDILLVKVNNYDTIKYLAKTTNWCISKNKQYWNSYVGQGKKRVAQYILFDFSKKEDDKQSIIGFTVRDNKYITNAHNFVNDNIVQRSTVKPQVRQFILRNENIFDILQNNKIPPMAFLETQKEKFEWNKETFLSYIMGYENEQNIDIICDENNKLAFIWQGGMFIDLFLNKNDMMGGYPLKVVVFADFNKSYTEGLMYSCIWNGCLDCDEEVPSSVSEVNNPLARKDISFNKVLKEFNLPFDVIKRIYGELEEFNDAVKDCDIETMSEIIKRDGFIEKLRLKTDAKFVSKLFDSITNSIFVSRTPDIIRFFYDHGLTLSDVVGCSNVASLINSLFDTLYDATIRERNFDFIVPTNEYYEYVLSGKEANQNKMYMYGMLYVFNMICKNENNSEIASQLNIDFLREFDSARELRREIVNNILKFVVLSKNKLNKLIPYIVYDNNIDAMRMVINSKAALSSINKLLDSLPNDHQVKKETVRHSNQ